MRTLNRFATVAFVCCLFMSAARHANAQELTFEFRVTINGFTSDWHMFGLREDALQGIDRYDLPEPPAAPGATFHSYLAMFEPLPGLPNRWLHDFRPVNSITLDRVELWQLNIESPAIGAACSIDVRVLDPVAAPFELYFFGPGTYYQTLHLPATINMTVNSTSMIQFFELRLDESVAAESATWGGVKGLFR